MTQWVIERHLISTSDFYVIRYLLTRLRSFRASCGFLSILPTHTNDHHRAAQRIQTDLFWLGLLFSRKEKCCWWELAIQSVTIKTKQATMQIKTQLSDLKGHFSNQRSDMAWIQLIITFYIPMNLTPLRVSLSVSLCYYLRKLLGKSCSKRELLSEN